MFISIVSKNGERVTQKWQNWRDISDSPEIKYIFDSQEQCNRFWAWAWEIVPYSEAKARVQKLGYEVWEGDGEYGFELPTEITRFQIWRRVDTNTRKPELVEFEGIKLKIKVS